MSAPPNERAALQVQLALLQQQAIEISTRLNFLSNVSLLNRDVLFKIFHFLCPDSELYLTRRKARAKHHDPTRDVRLASQVCHEWRQAAMESPSLWGALLDCNNESVDWLFELVRRSKASPVTIFLDLENIHSKLLAVSPKLQVVGSVIVIIGWRPVLQEVFNMLDQALQNGAAVNISDPSYSSSPTTISPLTFEPRTLNLRGRRVTTDLSHPCFAQLQDLSIVNPEIKFSSSEWVILMQGFPLLTHLRLDDAINNTDTPVVEPKTFRLPRLQSLSLLSKPHESGVDQFLNCFVPSKPYALKLTCAMVPQSRHTDLLLKAIETWCSAWVEGVNHKIHVISSHRKLAISNVDMPDDYTFKITINWRVHNLENISKVEGKVLQVMKPILQHTRELLITPDWWSYSEPICPSLFWAPFTSVRKICISNHPEDRSQNQSLLDFLKGLANDLGRAPDAPLPNIRCLALRRLSATVADEEHPVTAKLEALITLGREKGWVLEDLQLRQSPTAIGEIWRSKFGHLLTVSVFDPIL